MQEVCQIPLMRWGREHVMYIGLGLWILLNKTRIRYSKNSKKRDLDLYLWCFFLKKKKCKILNTFLGSYCFRRSYVYAWNHFSNLLKLTSKQGQTASMTIILRILSEKKTLSSRNTLQNNIIINQSKTIIIAVNSNNKQQIEDLT